MKVMHIAPIAHLDELRNQHSHMALAHLVYEAPKYAAFYKEMSVRGDFVLLDNGVAEGKELPWSVVCHAAELIGAQEVVLPDVIGSKNLTFDATRDALEANVTYHLRDRGVLFMGVPHGQTWEEWLDCAVMLLALGVDTIGLSRFEVRHDSTFPQTGRVRMAQQVRLINSSVQVHCLGNAGSPVELTFIKGIARSYDSSVAFAAARNDAVIRLDTGLLSAGTTGTIGWLFDPAWTLTEEQLELARENMRVLNELAERGTPRGD